MDKVKDTLTSIREGMIILVLVLLLAFPNWINKRLVEAGFTKGSIAGLEWEAKVEESQKNLERANKEVEAIKTELKSMSSAITTINSTTLPPETRNQVQRLQVRVDSSRTNLEGVDRSLKRSLNEHENILKNIKSKRD